MKKVIWQPLQGSQSLAINCPASIILYGGTRGNGKCFPLGVNVLTKRGWVRAGDITYDDKLVAMDGSLTDILGIYPQTNQDMYDITFHDGVTIKAGAQHRWYSLNSKTGYREGWKIRTTEQLYNMRTQCSIPYLSAPVAEREPYTGLDPYMLGYIIANGTTGSSQVTIYSIDDEILEYARREHGWFVHSYNQTTKRAISPRGQDQQWRDALGGVHKLADEKFVPPAIHLASPEVRLAMLQGLMDGDGNVESGAKSRYATVSLQLAEDVKSLVMSLGGNATIHKRIEPVDKSAAIQGRGWIYIVNISHHNQFNPFRVHRKASRWQRQVQFLTRGIKTITKSTTEPSVCFAVAHESHCFVVENYIVTHNTDCQLMRFRAQVGKGYGRFMKGLITDVQNSSLDDIILKSKRYFPQFNDGARFLSSKGDYKWVWDTGEELLFRAVSSESDYNKLHGHEFCYIGINELTKLPDATVLDLLLSLNRSSFVPSEHPLPDGTLLPEIPMCVFLTTNPSGIGKNWVKKRFIDQSAPGEILKREVKIFNPRTQQDEIIVKTQCHIFGSWRENTKLSPEYVADLESITDPVKRRAWLLGDWSGGDDGGMFDDLWDYDTHVVKPFSIPHTGFIDRCFDWGSSAPFSVQWFWNSDGSDVTLDDGSVISTVRGDIFLIAEWFGCQAGNAAKGLTMMSSEITKGIIEKEISLGIYGRVRPGAADNAIWNVQSGASVAADMAKPVRLDDGRTVPGVTWRRSDKSAGSRKTGWVNIRKFLEGSVRKIGMPREHPGLFVFNTCPYFIELFPIIPRDPKDMDDVDTRANDHLHDSLRYKVLSTGTGARTGRVKGLA